MPSTSHSVPQKRPQPSSASCSSESVWARPPKTLPAGVKIPPTAHPLTIDNMPVAGSTTDLPDASA